MPKHKELRRMYYTRHNLGAIDAYERQINSQYGEENIHWEIEDNWNGQYSEVVFYLIKEKKKKEGKEMTLEELTDYVIDLFTEFHMETKEDQAGVYTTNAGKARVTVINRSEDLWFFSVEQNDMMGPEEFEIAHTAASERMFMLLKSVPAKKEERARRHSINRAAEMLGLGE